MKVQVVLVAFLLLAISVNASSSITMCLDSSNLEINRTILTMNGTYNLTTTTSEDIYCPNGCSTTTNSCRVDNLNEIQGIMFILGAFLVLMILAMWISTKSQFLDYIILIIVAVFSMLIAATDVYSGAYRTLFIVFALVPCVMAFYNFFQRRNGED